MLNKKKKCNLHKLSLNTLTSLTEKLILYIFLIPQVKEDKINIEVTVSFRCNKCVYLLDGTVIVWIIATMVSISD